MPEIGRVTFSVFGTGAVVLVGDAERVHPALAAVHDELEDIDLACSRFRPDSELERVNNAHGHAVEVGPVLVDAVLVALRAARLTDGDVDPTVGSAVRVLGYDRDFAAVPKHGAPVVCIERVPGWHLVEVDPNRSTVRVPAGVRLDLGATAKALAADRAATRAAAVAGCGVLVSLGGDLAIAGDPPADEDGAGWDVRVTDWHGADPTHDPDGQTVRLLGGGLATSSTTVRRWTRGDEDMHHVVDPTTGRPAPVVWRTVSVAAETCVDANVASTAAVVRGERAPAWLDDLGLPARLVRPDGTVVRAGGWPADVDTREHGSEAAA